MQGLSAAVRAAQRCLRSQLPLLGFGSRRHRYGPETSGAEGPVEYGGDVAPPWVSGGDLEFLQLCVVTCGPISVAPCDCSAG